MKFKASTPISFLFLLIIPFQSTAEANPKSPPAIAQISRSDSRQMNPDSTDRPAGLYVQSEAETQLAFPLKRTTVNAKVSGNVSRVAVTQTFENPFDEPLEAIYIFPLPDEAAVDEMEIKIGDRIIKADIKKREEAREIYERAREQGQTAGLLEQERANIFTQSLANIRPGETIEVTIRYIDRLQFDGGDYEFVFPTVVGPRYIPGTPLNGQPGTDRVPDASRINPPVLPPEIPSDHQIEIAVEIEAGVPIRDLRSPSHDIVTENRGDAVRVTLAEGDRVPNKDLILRYRISGENTQATVLSQADSRGGHFAVYLIPALDYPERAIVPKDVVFLMDTSGSQQGEPLVKSKELMRRFVRGLHADDTFTIIDFSDTATRLSASPLNNTEANRKRAIAYIDTLEANGGTQLLNGIQAVTDFPPPPPGRLRSIVLVTDGYIGNETEVLAAVQGNLKPGNRLYSFGVGSSVNRFLLDRLAEVGRGTVRVVRQDEPIEAATEEFLSEINNPILTNIEVSWEGDGTPVELYPKMAPDLFSGQPLVLYGRKSDRRGGRIKIVGIAAGGDRYEKIIPVNFISDAGNPAIASLWGRAKIKDLMNQMFAVETTSGVETVTETALDYRLLSQYTAFVAVSEEVRVDPDGRRYTVEVPVEIPEGVSYEGIFGSPQNNQFSTTTRLGGSTTFSGADRLGSRLQSGGTRGNVPVAPAPLPSPVSPLEEPEQMGAISSRLEVVAVEGLDRIPTAELNRYLQGLSLPEGVAGELIFEISVNDGNVGRVILDDRASTMSLTGTQEELITIERVARSLQSWRFQMSGDRTIRLTLRVKP
ncbi:MAG: VIT domain-containing protein [Limnospira sp.]